MTQPAYKPWIVLHRVNGGRFASFPLTDENLASIRGQVSLSLIQRDINGTEHYTATARPRARRRTRR